MSDSLDPYSNSAGTDEDSMRSVKPTFIQIQSDIHLHSLAISRYTNQNSVPMFDLTCGVRLRAFRSETDLDLDSILSLYNDTRVAPLISERFVIPRGQKLKDEFKDLIEKSAEMFCIIETIPPSPSESAPQSTPLPQFIGITGLWGRLERGHRHVNYSIVLIPEVWGKGFGTAITKFMIDYAFHHLNMHRISLEVYEGNDRAATVYRK